VWLSVVVTMERQKLIQITWVLFLTLLAVVLSFVLYCVISQPSATQHKKEELRVNDRPVLETVEQVYQARTTGYSTFRIGSEYYIVENLPKEYVDYSSWWVRMP
jgi:predicted membrane protein